MTVFFPQKNIVLSRLRIEVAGMEAQKKTPPTSLGDFNLWMFPVQTVVPTAVL